MARPVEFDRHRALDASLRLFWRRGYLATSLSELLAATGLSRSSFYAAFGDKRTLFTEVIGLFSDRTRRMLLEARDAEGPLAGIRRFFEETLLEAPSARSARGCLMVNSVLELADVDDELCAIATRELSRIESVFEECFDAAQRAHQYPIDRSAADLAAHAMVLNQGLRVASRKPGSGEQLRRDVETAVSLLGLHAPQ